MAAAMTLGVVLCIAMAYFIWRRKTLAEVAVIEVGIRQRGEPLTLDELNAYYRGEGNAKDKSALFAKLLPQLNDSQFLAEYEPLPIAGLSTDEAPEDLNAFWGTEDAVREFFSKYRDLMDDLDVAALSEGDVRKLPNFETKFTADIERIQTLRSAARLCSLRIELAARDGDWDHAFDLIRVMFGLAEALRHEPSSSSQAFRAALRGVPHHYVAAWLPHAKWSDDQLRTLLQECLAPDWQAARHRGLLGERAYGRAIFDNPAIAGEDFADFAATPNAEDLRFYLEHMDQLIAANKFPPARYWLEHDRLNMELADDSTYYGKLHGLSRQVAPKTFGVDTFSGAARDRITAAHIAIELYRRQYNQIPQELENLVPAFLDQVPLDPYDGNPLRYRSEVDQIVVYSIGLNRVDDGGKEEDDPADIVVCVEQKTP